MVRRTTGGVAYDITGAGARTLCFVHGVGCRRTQFAALIAALTEGARCMAVDLPGHGDSALPPARASIDAFASAVIAVLDDAGVNEVVLVGHSLGAAVCVEVAARLGARVPHVIALDALVNPHVYPRQPRALVEVSRWTSRLFRPLMTRLLLRALMPAPRDDVLVREITRTMLAVPAAVAAHASASLAAWDRDAALVRASAAVTIIPAAEFVRPREAATLVPRCTVTAPIRGGHFFFMSRPEETAHAVRTASPARRVSEARDTRSQPTCP